jgi:hypothetical protein
LQDSTAKAGFNRKGRKGREVFLGFLCVLRGLCGATKPFFRRVIAGLAHSLRDKATALDGSVHACRRIANLI